MTTWKEIPNVHKVIGILVVCFIFGITTGSFLQGQLQLPDRFNRQIVSQIRVDSAQNYRLLSVETQLEEQVDSIFRMLDRMDRNICELGAADLNALRECRRRR